MVNYWTLEEAGIFVLILCLTRLLTLGVHRQVWHIATFSLLLLVAGWLFTYFLNIHVQVELLIGAVAVIGGLTWTGLVQAPSKYSSPPLWVSLSVSLALAALALAAAMWYRWWMAPAALFGALWAGFARDYVRRPAAESSRRAEAPRVVAAESPRPAQVGRPVTPRIQPSRPVVPWPPIPTTTARRLPEGRLQFRCPSCDATPILVRPPPDGLLRCPACQADVRLTWPTSRSSAGPTGPGKK